MTHLKSYEGRSKTKYPIRTIRVQNFLLIYSFLLVLISPFNVFQDAIENKVQISNFYFYTIIKNLKFYS